MAGGPVFCATLYSKLAVVTATVTVKFVKMVSSQNVPKQNLPDADQSFFSITGCGDKMSIDRIGLHSV